jgi:hypothetical protein
VVDLRRLVLMSAVLTFGGLALLLPSSPLLSLLTSGSTSSGPAAQSGFGASASTTDNTITIESLVGFGLIGVGLVFEVFSLFTDVGEAVVSPERSEATRP